MLGYDKAQEILKSINMKKDEQDNLNIYNWETSTHAVIDLKIAEKMIKIII